MRTAAPISTYATKGKTTMNKPQIGDVVTVRVKLTGTQPGGFIGNLRMGGDKFMVYHDEIISIEPRPLKAGDTVVTMNNRVATVLHIIDHAAWVKREGDMDGIVLPLSDLSRASVQS